MATRSGSKRRQKTTVTRAQWATRGSPSLLLNLMRECGASERKFPMVFAAFAAHCRDRNQLTETEERVVEAMNQFVSDACDRTALNRAVNGLKRTTDASIPLYRTTFLTSLASFQFPWRGFGVYQILDLDFASALIRDIFHPFAPAKSGFGSAPHSLALGIDNEQAFDRLPILADALEDAGCTNQDILDHCRGGGVHVRGCWVVDLLLGRE